MVIFKCDEDGLNRNEASLPSGDKQQSVTVKKVALRDLQNEIRNKIERPAGDSHFPKERIFIVESPKVSGIKRHRSDCSPSRLYSQPSFKDTINEQLVYVRRKLEPEPGKSTLCDLVTTDSLASTVFGVDGKSSGDGSKKEMEESRLLPVSQTFSRDPVAMCLGGSLSSHTTEKPIGGFPVSEPYHSVISIGSSVLAYPQETINVHWKERFVRLQNFLRACDESSQEDYLQMLRSLTAVGRSKHAVQLEKRAIHLLLEEGKELNRMKILNVLGKSPTTSQTPASVQSLKVELRKVQIDEQGGR